MSATLGRLELPIFLAGGAMTVALALATAGPAGMMPFLATAGLVAFLATVAVFIVAPHLATALTIPLFATLPTIKTLFLPGVGGVKDAVVVAATVAAIVVGLAGMRAGRGSGIDRRVSIPTIVLLALYVVNLGAGFGASAYDAAWMHGVRLTAEPILLLCVGLVLGGRRTLRWALASLVVTGVAVALYGLWQQYVGQWHLVGMGYSFDGEVRTINGRLRSFGTLDESFAYAGFLLAPLAAIVFLSRPRPATVAAGLVIAAGITVAYVRSAGIIAVALAGLWALRRGNAVPAAFTVAASVAAAVAFVFAGTGATQSQTVQPEPSLYLTINGRTDVWQVAFAEPRTWPFGQGVGEVGTAAARAARDVSRTGKATTASAVDSAYFSTLADVGIVGLAVRLVLLGALVTMAWRAASARLTGGWFALALMTVLLLDALTRDSFTGFPTAFLGLLLVGIALAAAREEDIERRALERQHMEPPRA